MNEQAGGAGAATSSETAKSGTTDSQKTDANAGGGESQNQGGGESFKPMTEAEQTAWKESIRRDMLAEARKQAKADAEREANAKAAKEKEDYKTLADQYEAELKTLKDELAKRDQDALRAKIAAKHKLPSDFAARLRGETEAELDADAKELAKHFGQRTAPDTEAGAGRHGSSGPSDKPIDKKVDPKQPGVTIDGKPLVPWPHLVASST